MTATSQMDAVSPASKYCSDAPRVQPLTVYTACVHGFYLRLEFLLLHPLSPIRYRLVIF